MDNIFHCLSNEEFQVNYLKAIGLSILIGVVPAATSAYADAPRINISSAETITPVVELYTSEGCSSCPRADNFLTLLGENIDQEFHAVPLAFHVDYWNRLGWEDPYSQAKFTDRQRWIAQLNRQRSIYTPEIVVSGLETRGGGMVFDQINMHNRKTADVRITMEVSAPEKGEVVADLAIRNETDTRLPEMFVAVYENNIVREIKGGENRGKTITYNFVVHHLSEPVSVARGDSARMVSMDIDETWNTDNLGLAVFVIDADNGQTLQALRTPLAALSSG